jgi:hypothetical protein
MATKRTYQPLQTNEQPAHQGTTLPLSRDVAVYYRQSSMKQVGNISTDMQQIDLPRHVKSLGWDECQIILIDEDEGVSGSKRIDERKGMSRLYNLIITQAIGTVAVQAEDRLFRDETQIQVNVFIDACVKSSVRVITPYFKYNFADKYEGAYHRLLFRMRAEQAADYLNSYVRGRLMAAKERMLLQGMWMGGNVPLGFMVDNRKMLSTGMPNPQWRKYEPFQPCAEVVVKLFETFVELGGNTSATLRYIFENGPYFPDFDDPEIKRTIPSGYAWAKPLRMLKRGNVYTTGSVALENMMTNPIYLGHWVHKGRIVAWNNHPPIVSEDLFFKAFNHLSEHCFDGSPNPDYRPRRRYEYSTDYKLRNPPTAIYTGLVGSYYEGQWRKANVSWVSAMKGYAYECHYRDLADNQHLFWSRHCNYFDTAITEMLHAKLRETFQKNLWEESLNPAQDDFDTEKRMLLHQRASVIQKMDALINNATFARSEAFLQALEIEYSNLEHEKKRLDAKIANIDMQEQQRDKFLKLAKQIQTTLDLWDEISTEMRQAVAQSFISEIVVNPFGKYKVVEVKICWRDDTSDTIHVAYRADGSPIWFPEEVETLTNLIEERADQLTISSALPNRNWYAIRLKAYEIIGERNFRISPKPIRDAEKYEDYLKRLERDGEQANRTSGNRWRDDELEILNDLLDKRATQLEIATALPIRTWEAIRKKAVYLRGDSSMVTEKGHLREAETISDYLSRTQTEAGAMPFLISENSSRQRRN